MSAERTPPPGVLQLMELNDSQFGMVVNDELRRQIGGAKSDSLHIIRRIMTQPPGDDVGTPRDPRNAVISTALQDPLLVERWYEALTHIKRQIELQLARRKAGERVRHDPKYPGWRVGITGILTSLEERVTLARRSLQKNLVSERAKALEADRDELGYKASALIQAIRRHQVATEANNAYEATDADRELWSWVQ